MPKLDEECLHDRLQVEPYLTNSLVADSELWALWRDKFDSRVISDCLHPFSKMNSITRAEEVSNYAMAKGQNPPKNSKNFYLL
jgi:hypothetical protein